MARGQIAKAEIANKILSNFEGSFSYNDGKEIRIPIVENGEDIQIKVTLTAAKENVTPGDENAMPGDDTVTVANVATKVASKTETVEPTKEELNNVSDLLKALGL